MRALTVRQPWAQLLVMGTKTIETRTRRAPASAIGQRIAITASAKRPPVYEHRDVNADLPPWINYVERHLDWVEHDDFHHGGTFHWIGSLGVVVGSGVLTASVPMHDTCADPIPDDLMYVTIDGRALFRQQTVGDPSIASNVVTTDCTDQLPYGDYSDGRWAWLFDDLAPITERCPWCWGSGEAHAPNGLRVVCVCGDAGRCQPIPVKGRLGVWNWTPEGGE